MIENSICHGHFTMIDDTGNIIVDSDNMIVADGRKQIMTSGFPKTSLAVFLSSDNTMTEADFTYSNISNDIIERISLSEGSNTNGYTLNEDNICVSINASYTVGDSDSTKKVSSAGLIFGDSNSPTLFSRLSFETKYLKAGSKYTINYTIQF